MFSIKKQITQIRYCTMPKKNKKTRTQRNNCLKKIKYVETTNECLSSRSGMFPFANFLHGSTIDLQLEDLLSNLRKSSKGISLSEAFFQILLFFADGTEKSLGAFDKMKLG